MFSYWQVAVLCSVYLSVLFAIAFSTERGWIGQRLVEHPVVYIFSLGIFASAWSFYGIIELAHRFGLGAFAYYLGTGALFMFAPLLLRPLIVVARRYQINSMADLLVFRYHSHSVGGVVTLLLLAALAPLVALQLQAVADTIQLLTAEAEAGPQSSRARPTFALIYVSVVAMFAMAYGSNREHHKGLVVVMALESLFKLCGLLTAGAFAIAATFGGLGGLSEWLGANPELRSELAGRAGPGTTHALALIFIATAVAMPHIFHMTVVENPAKRKIVEMLTWAFPLFLLAMAAPVLPILWAGYERGFAGGEQYFPLLLPLADGALAVTLAVFVGGLSAATGALVAIALALSTMILNHWILPWARLETQRGLYRQLLWMRRILIFAVLMGGYMFYVTLENRVALTDLALASFIGTLQLLPGAIGVTHWAKGNRRGLLAGLLAGGNIWFFGLLLPMLNGWASASIPLLAEPVGVGMEHWQSITLWSMGLNLGLFLLVSYLSPQTQEEIYSAELCSQDELSHPMRLSLDVRSPEEIVARLATRIGRDSAELEMQRALTRLGLRHTERRPYALRRLRDELEANLAGLLGIALASEIMDQLVPCAIPKSEAATDINLMESRLGQVREHLTGLAAELNHLRLHHRRTLEQLPLATCSVGDDFEVLMWNGAMAHLTGIAPDEVTGSHLANVLEPWGSLLYRFALSTDPRFYKCEVTLNGQTHWITLHKAFLPSPRTQQAAGQVLILEDVTELQLLERELIHSERLASVGRLAAGVAHEIGNPITGIACLAQNLKFETEDPDVLQTGHDILSLTERVSRIVHTLVSFSHAGQARPQLKPVAPRQCAQEAVNLLSLQRDKPVMVYNNQIPEVLQVMGDFQQLVQVFVNLLANARDASPADASVTLGASQASGKVTLWVEDEGSGIPEDLQKRVFEPFYTTKEPGEGTGLGLAMVYSIIEDHQGSIQIESPVPGSRGVGTRFMISLPEAPAL